MQIKEKEEVNDKVIWEVESQEDLGKEKIWSQKEHIKQPSSILKQWRFLCYRMLNNCQHPILKQFIISVLP
jgi:hypothetical protein